MQRLPWNLRLLDVVKRPALRCLHASRAGQVLLHRIYLAGEEGAEQALFAEPCLRDAPPACAARFERHQRDELRHARLFRAELTRLGAPPEPLPSSVVSRWKLRRFAALASRADAQFRAGRIVPLLVVAWRLERMGVRVLERHVAVLERHDSAHPSLTTLRRVLADERAHVALCQLSIADLTSADEGAAVDRLARDVDRADQAFGTLGAVLLLLIGGHLWLAERLASSTSRSPTRADT